MINLYQFLSLRVSTCMLKLLSQWLMDKTWYFRHLTSAQQRVCSLSHNSSTYIEAVSCELSAYCWQASRSSLSEAKRWKAKTWTWKKQKVFRPKYRLSPLSDYSHCLQRAIVQCPHRTSIRTRVKSSESLADHRTAQSSISSLSLHRCCSGAC